MPLQERVAQHEGALTAADRRVLEVLLSHPTEAAFLRADEVAARAGVHMAAATRLAQKLGYGGYPKLRTSLQSELLGGVNPAERVRRRLEHVGDEDLVSALVTDEGAMLAELPRHVSQRQLNEVAALLLEARRTAVFGQGNATVLVELMARRLRRFGLPVVALPPGGRDLGEQALSLAEDDVVLTFAFSAAPPALEPLLAETGQRGITTILVTDTLAGTLAPAPDIVLAAPRGPGREFQSLTVPMAICNALVLTLARQAPERCMAALERLGALLDTFHD